MKIKPFYIIKDIVKNNINFNMNYNINYNINEISNAVLILTIVTVLVIIISILYKNYMSLEPFSNYLDVKTKTINWCKKMQASGLLNPEQYDQCVSTFKDAAAGIIPKNFKTPDTGMERNYSLYNLKAKALIPSISGDNTNNVMLVTYSGLYMACNPENIIYYVSNINDPTINQKELYFTLIPQSNEVYSIMSPYNKYLTIDLLNTETQNNDSNITKTTLPLLNKWSASFTGNNIGPMSTWTVSKINDKVSFESIQYNGFYISFNNDDKSLNIIYGREDSAMWTMIPEEQINVNNKYGAYTGVEHIVKGENILQKIKNMNIQIMCLNEMKNGLVNLQDIIRQNYTNIAQYINKKLNSKAARGLNNDDINKVINKITNMKNYYLQQINEQISKININLTKLNEGELSIEYNNYLNDLSSELNKVKLSIQNNNKLMGRQQDNYDKINKDYSYVNNKKEKIKKIDETSKINMDFISNYNSQNSYILKVYPIVIIILGIALLYLTYLTIIKFKNNIYDKYT